MWFCLILGTAVYPAKLRSFLILPEFNDPIETLEDVANSPFSITYNCWDNCSGTSVRFKNL